MQDNEKYATIYDIDGKYTTLISDCSNESIARRFNMANRPNGRFRLPNDEYMPNGDISVLNKNINEVGLSEETTALLQSVGIKTVCDTAKCQMKHLYRIPKMGKKNVFEVLRKLQSLNLDFRRVERPVDNVNSEAAPKSVPQNQSKANLEKANVGKRQNSNAPQDNVRNADNNDANRERRNKNRDNRNNDYRVSNRSNEVASGVQNDTTAPKGDQIVNNRKKKIHNRDERRDNRQTNDRSAETAPRRVKINSYDADSVNLNNTRQHTPIKKRTLKEERSLNIAKKISNLQPLKNEDGMYKFFKHGKFGYKNEQGKIVIEPTYDEAFNFKEGLACVELKEQVGFINTLGEIVIPIVYDTACSFSEGLASVTKDEKCGYIDKEGNVVFDFIYESATSFDNNISLVKKDGKWGYMDRNSGDIRLR